MVTRFTFSIIGITYYKARFSRGQCQLGWLRLSVFGEDKKFTETFTMSCLLSPPGTAVAAGVNVRRMESRDMGFFWCSDVFGKFGQKRAGSSQKCIQGSFSLKA